ncbi:MAG: flavin-dependent oxidoreductase [Pseudomonadota bacterium]
MKVLIAGGGIAGLIMGLTLHQLGIPFHLYERVKTAKPLGVGVNLQPTAVRELFSLGLAKTLAKIGVETRDYGFYTRSGVEIWTEPRGRDAGYNWPQFSVHRGKLQMALIRAVQEHCGMSSISFGCKALGFKQTDGDVTLHFETERGRQAATGDFLIAADGIHSALRAQMVPNEGPPIWNGAVMWRGTTVAKPFLSDASMILAGNDSERFVAYPISNPDPLTGDAVINWIAEKTVPLETDVDKGNWNKAVSIDRFRATFANWDFGWINVPALIAHASRVYEYPMVDRDPLSTWTKGRVTLIGDAAHATYPVGSSGASQAILDARHLGAALKKHTDPHAAAVDYEARVRPIANKVIIANRTSGGPDAIMQIAEDRCDGDFTQLDTLLPYEERAAHAEAFKKIAGISVAATNTESPIIVGHLG